MEGDSTRAREAAKGLRASERFPQCLIPEAKLSPAPNWRFVSNPLLLRNPVMAHRALRTPRPPLLLLKGRQLSTVDQPPLVDAWEMVDPPRWFTSSQDRTIEQTA